VAATFREVVAGTGMLSGEARGAHADITGRARERVAVAVRAVWAPEVALPVVEEAVGDDDR
jgi:hypothetical protein